MKKKVLFLMPALIGGGAEKVLIDILKNFDYQCYDISLFLEYREGVYLKDVPQMVHLFTLHGRNNLWFQRLHRRLVEHKYFILFHEWIYRCQFLYQMRGKSYDTIISFMEGAAVKFHSYVYDRAQRNLSWVHIDLKKKHWTLDFFRDEKDEMQCYEKMDQILFVSEEARTKFLELYPIEKNKCNVLYNLIDEEEITKQALKQNIPKRKFTICMVGRLNQQKRYDRAIKVAYLLKQNGYDIEFWILGEGELENELHSLIKKYDLTDSFLLKGFVKPPYAYMTQADLFLNTSEAEGFSLVIAEAFCLGVPVVSTKTTGPVELLDHSRYGILVDEEIDAIYQGVKLMIDNDLLRQEYRRKALERSKIFQVEKTMKQIYSAIS